MTNQQQRCGETDEHKIEGCKVSEQNKEQMPEQGDRVFREGDWIVWLSKWRREIGFPHGASHARPSPHLEQS